MMRHTIRLLCAGASLAVAAPAAFGQESLMEIYQRALQNDPAIQEAEARLLASSEVRPQARSQLLPSLQLGASTSFSHSEDPNPPIDFQTGEPNPNFISSERENDSTNWNVNISQTVFDWGQFVTLKQADKLVAQAETEFEIAKQDLLLRVSEAYFNVLAAEDTLEAQQASRQAFERQLEQAQRRYDVGLIAITDVQQLQANFDQSVSQEIEAQRLLATAQEQLREIIGEYVTDLASPEDEIPLVEPDPASADEWVEAALEQNLALIAARIAADVAQDDIRIARSARLPTVSFSSGWQDNQSESRRLTREVGGDNRPAFSTQGSEGYNWSLDFRIPLFTGGLNSSRIRQSVYQHRASLEAVERVARETERLTRDSYLGVISSISQVRALQQAVRSAETALAAIEAGFEVGTQTSVDVSIAQEQVRLAQTNYAQARYAYILNTLRLKQAAGSLSVEDIELIDSWLVQ
ncbi:MAG TPA: TolC family outer membrane protein [Gammaproteobacteria bacterium]